MKTVIILQERARNETTRIEIAANAQLISLTRTSAARTARTSGSLTATRSDSVGTTAPQLAPVLRPDCVAGKEHAYETYGGCIVDKFKRCRNCGYIP